MGEEGTNCISLITGYFMCESTINAKKVIEFLMAVINCNFWSNNERMALGRSAEACRSLSDAVDAVTCDLQGAGDFCGISE